MRSSYQNQAQQAVKAGEGKVVPLREAFQKRAESMIEEASREAFRSLNLTDGFQQIIRGEINLSEYRSMMKEIYYYTRETPQMLGVLSSRLRGNQRAAIRVLFKHALAEIGHDQLALHDAIALKEDGQKIEIEQPLPSTTALISYAYYQIERLEPTGFLGFLYFLEYIANAGGGNFIQKLNEAGIPESAMSFVKEHAEVDPAHNKLLGKYVASLVLNQQILDSVVYCIRCASELYGQMISRAIENAYPLYPSLPCSEERRMKTES